MDVLFDVGNSVAVNPNSLSRQNRRADRLPENTGSGACCCKDPVCSGLPWDGSSVRNSRSPADWRFAVDEWYPSNPKYRGIRTYLNPVVIAVYGSFFAITFVTTWLYQDVELTLSTLLYKTEYAFIALFSVLFLKERFTKRKIAGFVVILLGVLIYTMC